MNTDEKNGKYSEEEWLMITRCITGTCSDDEKARFTEWMNENISRRDEIDLLRKSFLRKSSRVSVEQTQKGWDEIIRAIQFQSLNNSPGSSTAGRLIRNILKIAAVLLLISGSYYIIRQTGILDNSKLLISWNEKTTSLGEKAVITLIDGTVVTLNADSKLKYPVNFNSEEREIFLEGEAFFSVAHDSLRPFTVHTRNIRTTVLGTKFDVKAFAEEKVIEVSLVEGKVKVDNENLGDGRGTIILNPMQQLIYEKQKDANTVAPLDLQKETGWISNNLKFDDEPLTSVFPVLERTYGVKFEIGDKTLASKKITANFKNDSFNTVAEVIKKLTGLNYKTTKENNRVIKIVYYKNKSARR